MEKIMQLQVEAKFMKELVATQL